MLQDTGSLLATC